MSFVSNLQVQKDSQHQQRLKSQLSVQSKCCKLFLSAISVSFRKPRLQIDAEIQWKKINEILELDMKCSRFQFNFNLRERNAVVIRKGGATTKGISEYLPNKKW